MIEMPREIEREKMGQARLVVTRSKRRFLAASFGGVLVRGRLVLVEEVLVRVAGQPEAELRHLLAETVDGLGVHVGLGD